MSWLAILTKWMLTLAPDFSDRFVTPLTEPSE